MFYDRYGMAIMFLVLGPDEIAGLALQVRNDMIFFLGPTQQDASSLAHRSLLQHDTVKKRLPE